MQLQKHAAVCAGMPGHTAGRTIGGTQMSARGWAAWANWNWVPDSVLGLLAAAYQEAPDGHSQWVRRICFGAVSALISDASMNL